MAADRLPDPAPEWESSWLIERVGDTVGRPFYWVESPIARGLGTWTDDPWRATRYVKREDAERELYRWAAHPHTVDAKVVSHGFQASPVSAAVSPAAEPICPGCKRPVSECRAEDVDESFPAVSPAEPPRRRITVTHTHSATFVQAAGVPALHTRADRGEWLVTLRLDDFLEAIKP